MQRIRPTTRHLGGEPEKPLAGCRLTGALAESLHRRDRSGLAAPGRSETITRDEGNPREAVEARTQAVGRAHRARVDGHATCPLEATPRPPPRPTGGWRRGQCGVPVPDGLGRNRGPAGAHGPGEGRVARGTIPPHLLQAQRLPSSSRCGRHRPLGAGGASAGRGGTRAGRAVSRRASIRIPVAVYSQEEHIYGR